MLKEVLQALAEALVAFPAEKFVNANIEAVPFRAVENGTEGCPAFRDAADGGRGDRDGDTHSEAFAPPGGRHGRAVELDPESEPMASDTLALVGRDARFHYAGVEQRVHYRSVWRIAFGTGSALVSMIRRFLSGMLVAGRRKHVRPMWWIRPVPLVLVPTEAPGRHCNSTTGSLVARNSLAAVSALTFAAHAEMIVATANTAVKIASVTSGFIYCGV